MSLETGNFIKDLVITNPPGSDDIAEGPAHLQLIKNILKIALNGFTGSAITTGPDVGSVNAAVLTPSPGLPNYSTNGVVLFTPVATNTATSPVINISGLGAKEIVNLSGAALSAGELEIGTYYWLVYDGTKFRIVSSPTKTYIDNLSFSSVLPGQGGNAGKYLTTDGANASWSLALLANTPLTGTPTAPTAAVGTNTTQLATTAFVVAQASNATPIMDGAQTPGVSDRYSRTDHVHPADTSRAPLNSPALTGLPTTPTSSISDDSTTIANTAFVQDLVASIQGSVNLNTSPVKLNSTASGDRETRLEFYTSSPPLAQGDLTIVRKLGVNGNLEFRNQGVGLLSFYSNAIIMFQTAGTVLRPGPDGTIGLGDSVHRWTDVWAVDGTINTSNVADKKDIEPSGLGLPFILALQPKSWRWIVGKRVPQPDGSILETPGIRKHYGLVGQEVKAALQSLGDPDFGGWIQDDPNNPDSPQSLRYSEFIAPLIASVHNLAAQVTALTGRITALELKP